MRIIIMSIFLFYVSIKGIFALDIALELERQQKQYTKILEAEKNILIKKYRQEGIIFFLQHEKEQEALAKKHEKQRKEQEQKGTDINLEAEEKNDKNNQN